jgi:outer membrane lipoprotein-sorting protein
MIRNMKKILTLLATLLFAVAAFGQTAEEIVNRMDAEMNKHDYEKEGLYMVVDIKIPILGTMSSKVWTLGEKIKMEAKTMGVLLVTWTDETTEWTYNSKTEELEIENRSGDSKSQSEGDTEMFTGITEGYDVSIKKETADAWYILCKKSKDNKEKDDPKTMDLVVAKETYYPMSLSAKMSGVTMTMRDLRFGVSEKDVTFDPKAYPGAKVVDKR